MLARDIAQMIRPLSPTALRILVIMFFANGQSFTGRELAGMLSKTPNSISSNIKQLEFYGLVQYNGRQHGWSLAGLQQTLFPALHGEITAARPALQGDEGKVQPPASQGVAVVNEIQNILDDPNKNLDHPNFFGSTPLPSSSSLGYTKGKSEEERKKKPEIQKNLELVRLLVSAGVGSRSQKMDEILDLELDVAYVAAHCEAAKDEPVSYLITRLLSGDPAPVPPALVGCDLHGRVGWVSGSCLVCQGVMKQ